MSQNDEQGAARFAPPRARVADVAPHTDVHEPATRASRFWASIIDMIVIVVVVMVLAALAPWELFKSHRGFWSVDLGDTLLGFAIFMAINAYLLHTHGQTVGKRLLKIRIVRMDGSRASLMTLAGIRYGVGYVLNVVMAVGMLYGLIDTLSIFRESRRCLHDMMADTIVVKA